MLPILAPKMARPQNSGSALKIALQFCTMKGPKRDMEIILMVFLKKSYLEQLGHFSLKMVRPHNFESALTFFLHNKRGQEVHETFIGCF